MRTQKMQFKAVSDFISFRRFMKLFVCISSLLLLASCAGKQQNHPTAATPQDVIKPPRITILSDLPDSLKPKVTYLKDVPKPVVTKLGKPVLKKSFIDSITGMPIPQEAIGRANFTTYGSEDGLKIDMLNDIYIDSRGYLWVTTWGVGLSRFDGKEFVNYGAADGLCSNDLQGITEDLEGNMWFGTWNGLSKFDGRTYLTIKTDQGLIANTTNNIRADAEGNIWISTASGISKVNGREIKNYTIEDGLTSNEVRNIFHDHKGKHWFSLGAYPGKGLDILVDSQFIHLDEKDGLPSGFIQGMEEDRDGNVWLGSWGGGVSKYDGKTFTNYSVQHGLVHTDVSSTNHSIDGYIWLGTWGGLSRFDGTQFVNFTTKHGLGDNMIYKVISDRLGNLFIATILQGFSIYEGAGIEWFLAEDGFLEYQPSSLSCDYNGNVWYGSRGGGLRRLSKDGLVQYTTTQGLLQNNIIHIHPTPSGTILFSYELPAFSSFDGENLTSYSTAQGLTHTFINCILKDTEERVWLGSYSGITCLDSLSCTTYSYAQGLPDSTVTKVIESPLGVIWVATGNGIACITDTSIISLNTDQGLSENYAFDIAEDKEGNIWVATYEGLNLLRKETIDSLLSNKPLSLKRKLFETFYINDGLPDNIISKIEVDEEGNIIVGTIKGIAILTKGVKSFDTQKGIDIYNAQNGYNIKDVLHLDTDTAGIIWISTGSRKTGMVRFDRQALIQDTFPPSVEIQQIQIHGRSLSWYDLLPPADSLLHLDSQYSKVYNTEELRAYNKILSAVERDSIRNSFSGVTFDSISKWNPVPIGLKIPYNHNNLTFEFHAIVLARNKAVRYQYMLEGYDADWSPVSNKAAATFGNIQEGKYTFKVKARSPDGVWSEPISYSFTVLPPWHRTWWAYSLYGLALLSMMYAGQYYLKRRTILTEQEKSKQKQAILNERLRISRDLHDEVGATLSGISMYSHIAKEQIKAQSREGLFSSLNIMQESSGDMVKKLNDIIWLLNPEQARLQQLVEKLEEYIRQLAEYKNVSVSVDIIDHISAIELPLEVRRNIYLIFKEAINNSFKYSQADSISLTIRSAEANLEFILQDDGVGFDIETVKRGNGLNNMQSRAKEIGATIRMDSAPGRGTRLSLTYRLPS